MHQLRRKPDVSLTYGSAMNTDLSVFMGTHVRI